MKEHPILFSGPMVRAILEGRKTQTRRLYKPKPSFPREDGEITPTTSNRWTDWGPCPYGVPGDRLWVRETWAPDPPADHKAWDNHSDTYVTWSGCGSKLTGIPTALRSPKHCIYREGWAGDGIRWTPSIHMPRWASRITLEIVSVRVERLRDITEEDAIAEGVPPEKGLRWDQVGYTPREAFRRLWDSIYNDSRHNPYVRVVEFRKVEDKR